jgi:phosphohistidine phosphatase
MVRTLVLLRHAKAEHPAGVADVDRSLTARGHADSAAAGAWLAAAHLAPDLVLCSPSRRTRETWHGVKVALSARPRTVYDRRVYDGGADDVLEVIAETGSDVGTVLVIGHNPTLSMLSARLDPGGGPEDGLRTCTAAVHRVPAAWADLGPKLAPLVAAHTARA